LSNETKEKRVIKYSEEMLMELERKYSLDDLALEEYRKLLTEYKRLSKRLNIVVRSGDALSLSLVKTNKKIIKTAREKISQIIKKQDIK